MAKQVFSCADCGTLLRLDKGQNLPADWVAHADGLIICGTCLVRLVNRYFRWLSFEKAAKGKPC